MSNDFSFEDIASDVLSDYDQDDVFKRRFIGFCQNAMEGSTDDGDLNRLIKNVTLNKKEKTDELTN